MAIRSTGPSHPRHPRPRSSATSVKSLSANRAQLGRRKAPQQVANNAAVITCRPTVRAAISGSTAWVDFPARDKHVLVRPRGRHHYDPDRNAPVGVALLHGRRKALHLAPAGLSWAKTVCRRRVSGDDRKRQCLPLWPFPWVRAVHIRRASTPAGVARLVRTARASAQVMAKEGYVPPQVPSTGSAAGASRDANAYPRGSWGKPRKRNTSPGQSRPQALAGPPSPGCAAV